MFPRVDGFGGQPAARLGAPETSPCHVTAKQDSGLDLRRVGVAFAAVWGLPREQARLGRIESDPSRGRWRRQRIGSVRYLLGTWAASARLLRMRKPQTSARRPIQTDEVEHPAHVSLCGIGSQILARFLRSLLAPQLGRTARHAGPRLVQLLSGIVASIHLCPLRGHGCRVSLGWQDASRSTTPLHSCGRQWQKNRLPSNGCCLRHRW